MATQDHECFFDIDLGVICLSASINLSLILDFDTMSFKINIAKKISLVGGNFFNQGIAEQHFHPQDPFLAHMQTKFIQKNIDLIAISICCTSHILGQVDNLQTSTVENFLPEVMLMV